MPQKRYDAFVSYSTKADSRRAVALRRKLERLGKTWYQRRSLQIYLDQESLGASANLSSTLQSALASTNWFILLCSPEAAASPWVEQEVNWWLAHQETSRMILVITGGTIAWDNSAGDFDWSQTTALPRALANQFRAQPRWVDFRNPADSSPSRPSAELVASVALDVGTLVLGTPRDDLASEDARQLKRNMRWALSAAALLFVFAVGAVFAAIWALRERDNASTRLRELQFEYARVAIESGRPSTAQDVLANLAGGDPADLRLSILARQARVEGREIEFEWDDHATVVPFCRAFGADPEKHAAFLADSSPDGVQVIKFTRGKAELLWQSDDFVLPPNGCSPHDSTIFSRDGQHLVLLARPESKAAQAGAVHLVSVSSGQSVKVLAARGSSAGLLNQAGESLTFVLHKGELRISSFDENEPRFSAKAVSNLAVAHDGRTIAVLANGNRLRLVSTEEFETIAETRTPAHRAGARQPDGLLQISQDGRTVLASGPLGTWVHQFPANELARRTRLLPRPVQSAAMALNGRRVLLDNGNAAVLFAEADYCPDSGSEGDADSPAPTAEGEDEKESTPPKGCYRPVTTLPGVSRGLWQMPIVADAQGQVFFTSSPDGAVAAWHAGGGELIANLGSKSAPYGTSYVWTDPTSSFLVALGHSHMSVGRSQALALTWAFPQRDLLAGQMSWLPGSSKLVIADGEEVCVHDQAGPSAKKIFCRPGTTFALSRAGDKLLIAGPSSVAIWATSGWSQLSASSLPPDTEPLGATLSEDGKTWAVADGDRVQVYRRGRSSSFDDETAGREISLHPLGRWLTTGPRIYDLDAAEPTYETCGGIHGGGCAFLNDGRVLLIHMDSSNGTAQQFRDALILNAADPELLARIGGRIRYDSEQEGCSGWGLSGRLGTGGYAVDFDPQFGSREALVRSVEQLGKEDEWSYTLTGHSGTVEDLALTRDRQIAATASADGSIRLWDIREKNAKQLAIIPGFLGRYLRISFDASDRHLLLQDNDGNARLVSLR